MNILELLSIPLFIFLSVLVPGFLFRVGLPTNISITKLIKKDKKFNKEYGIVLDILCFGIVLCIFGSFLHNLYYPKNFYSDYLISFNSIAIALTLALTFRIMPILEEMFSRIFGKNVEFHPIVVFIIIGILEIIIMFVVATYIMPSVFTILPYIPYPFSSYISSCDSYNQATVYILNRMDTPILYYGYSIGKSSITPGYPITIPPKELVNITINLNVSKMTIIYIITDVGVEPIFNFNCSSPQGTKSSLSK